MNDEVVIQVEHVSKKFCKNLKTSMRYGIEDIGRNAIGMSSRCGQLRKQEFWAVDDVSFEVEPGETLGLIGPNGSGKTTLLKMLNGIFWPDKGKITVKGRMGVLIDVGAGFHPMLTARENIYVNAAILGMSKRETEEKFDSIVEFADIGNFIDTAVKYYSSGMFVRLGFAVAAHCEPDILLVDEVLAVGDEGFQHKCFNKIGELKKKGTTVVLVSHNMHLVQTFADRALVLNNGTAHGFESVADAVHAYSNLFVSDKGQGLEKIASGNEEIQFYDVCINKRIFRPLETLSLILKYVSSKEFQDVEVDLAIFSSTEPTQYFQATNHAFDETINLRQGRHELILSIENVPLNNALTRVEVAVFSGKRRRGGELLFWWQIPVEFRGAAYSTGRNFLKVTYSTDSSSFSQSNSLISLR
jgi:lipopolysaccharide transport system ATP-binding protein